jgi:hypothetical protein
MALLSGSDHILHLATSATADDAYGAAKWQQQWRQWEMRELVKTSSNRGSWKKQLEEGNASTHD